MNASIDKMLDDYRSSKPERRWCKHCGGLMSRIFLETGAPVWRHVFLSDFYQCPRRMPVSPDGVRR